MNNVKKIIKFIWPLIIFSWVGYGFIWLFVQLEMAPTSDDFIAIIGIGVGFICLLLPIDRLDHKARAMQQKWLSCETNLYKMQKKCTCHTQTEVQDNDECIKV